MFRLFKQKVSWWFLVIGIIVAAGAVWQATRFTYDVEMESVVETGEERLTLYTGALESVLNRMENLPYVMAHNDAVARLLIHQDNLEQLNRDLESLNYWAGTKFLYVMDAVGEVVASSTWRDPVKLIGKNYAFRPYFTAAKEGQQGHYFAIGLETNQPGLYMSHGIYREGRFLGVVVVKANLDPLIDDWREGGETVLISDANGVIILSSRAEWAFKTLTPLDAGKRELIRSERQYSNQSLEQAPLQIGKNLEEGGRLVRAAGQSYLMISQLNPQLDWTLSYFAPLKQVHQRTQAVTTIGTILALLILALGMYIRERYQKKLSRKKLKEAETIKEVNLRLQEKVEEHRRTEQALRDAQAELVQSSKLAALGQMAAGIVHELNQPISAMRTYAASGRLLLDRKESDKVHETFASVERITDHMASITAQLKTFAYKAPKLRKPVVVQECIDGALAMTGPLLSEAGVSLHKQIPDEPVVVSGDRGRIEQVLVNLIRNAVDAMRECENRDLNIQILAHEQEAEIIIEDSGTGIVEKNLEELFNPFFTTKEVGEGLGLGLSISYRIVTDLGGTIHAMNNPGLGARFIAQLPLLRVEETDEKVKQ
ncbi:MAG: sensor histidine kinase [Deltaproteobacteria bacterium]|nr:MAG: sensor histidine kinase [Deltaproteobacteria bacterium]